MRAPEVQDVYQYIVLFAAQDVDSIETWQKSQAKESTMGDKTYIKLADMTSKHEGIRMEESKTDGDTDWLNVAISTFVGIGLGLVPYVGPFLALGFDAVNDYLANPEAWAAKNNLKLSAQTTAELVKSGADILKFYRSGKVPQIRFKSHLKADARQPVYVGEDPSGTSESQPSTQSSNAPKEARVPPN
ncbi:uncharacterized protein LDX57_005927 [Aspergillus melleus]|uniref:uncharacterized protein n=1 Tax=Aspergillus melleus TaxID=138277 RepID=UPI001E8E97B5|nr:uncharacterized protein LDX57_005927 [Aspergillus melleus]KAH8428224.1 hypothetical protein LDX57_005927 [Aspergillus melleus]